ncbi:protein of unknown function (plasmid) [Azospirillum lipoferum 4B]|uniref:DUF2946 domain-containing protein n=2 Tax=Azospirillum lipoferum TaxID=193 RepID=G7ZDI4_AZOL4|nr:protein of unknown function [Azospirillum lipoferum 4B]
MVPPVPVRSGGVERRRSRMAFGRWTVQQVRRLGLLAGMAALLLQVIAWSWMPVATAVAGTGGTTSLLICSAGGFTTIDVDPAEYGPAEYGIALIGVDRDAGDSPGGTSDPTPFGSGHCPLCPLIAGLALPPPPLTVGPVVVAASDTSLLPGERIAAGWFLSTLQARGPPSFA